MKIVNKKLLQYDKLFSQNNEYAHREIADGPFISLTIFLTSKRAQGRLKM